MVFLKVVFYGILAFIERHPIFCLIMLALIVCMPIVFKVIGWIILGIIALALIGFGIMALRFRKIKRQMEEQIRNSGMGAGFGNMGAGFDMGGFSNMNADFGNMGGMGMTLEDFVKQMQAQADARKQQAPKQENSTKDSKKSSIDSSDYVDFEEVK